ncbi:MAG: acyl-[acyl-carrier-protein]--UDP-N-acetylglucosamine O-acyltransferase [Porticoccus sp.]|jgi:UDP-N-acetylglucosamine acyltransferase|nr:acyl-[acyl-carrier-protein]--UDP-N-acetylglucosamine O-acyltransferase [Porticoccus sp.]
MSLIHATAIIDPTAELDEGVEIGPWTSIGPNVKIGSGTTIQSHVLVKGPTIIGKNNRIFQFSTIGEDTPDLKYAGEPTKLVIGDNNTIREGVTIHRGTIQDRGVTTIGDNNLMMAYVHIGHDSTLGSNCILVNNASLSGHVTVGDWAILSGYVLVHQFVSIGSHTLIGPAAFLPQDVPAYVTAFGSPAEPKTVNTVGLKRRGFNKDAILAIKQAYKILYRQGLSLDDALAKLAKLAIKQSEVQLMLDSVKASSRGIIR